MWNGGLPPDRTAASEDSRVGVSLVFLHDWCSISGFLSLASHIPLGVCESEHFGCLLSLFAVPGCRFPWGLVRLFLSHPALWEVHWQDCYSHRGAFKMEGGVPSGWAQSRSRVWLVHAVHMAFQPLLLSWPGSLPLFFILLLAALGLCCCARAFSSCSEQGLLSVCHAQTSHCSGFSRWGAQALGAWASVVVVQGLSCSVACRIFPDQISNLCLLHWQVVS